MKNHFNQLLKISLATFSILALFPILSSTIGMDLALAQSAVVADTSYNISSNSLTRVMCNALRLVTGSAGKTFASFAIIATGIGFFTGKVSWGLMIGVTAGIATMFGAPSIVAAISGQDTNMGCSVN